MPPRPVRIDAHDGEGDCWSMAHAKGPGQLAPWLSGYTDYQERTTSFEARREMPSLRPVMIVNLGEPIAVTGADGACLTLQAGEGFLGGIHERHAVSQSTGSQQGVHVRLTMQGFTRLLGRASGELGNRVLKLTDMLGPPAATLGERLAQAPHREARFRLLDDALASWLAEGLVQRPEPDWAFERLSRNPGTRIDALAQEIGCSRKMLAAQFRARYGVCPKTVGRLARFGRAVAAIECDARADWAGLAAEAGYYDQSHMIRDFTEFAGLTPSAYQARLLPLAGGVRER